MCLWSGRGEVAFGQGGVMVCLWWGRWWLLGLSLFGLCENYDDIAGGFEGGEGGIE